MDSVVLAAVIGMFLFFILVTVLGYLQLKQIHAAVNSNMTTALNKIEDLHARVAELVEEQHVVNRKKAVKKKVVRKGRK